MDAPNGRGDLNAGGFVVVDAGESVKFDRILVEGVIRCELR